jgi:hypothetical protein
MRAVVLACACVACHHTASPPPITCGSGTVQQGGRCVAMAGLACGTGTHDNAQGACVPDAGRFLIRAPSTIRADGWSATEVRVVGTAPDGTPDVEPVQLLVDRATAGAFASPSFTLDELGGASNFVPCNSNDAACLGPARLDLVRASAPQTAVATVDVTLVAPPQIASSTPCLAGGNILYFDGASFYYDGTQTFTTATGATFDVFGGSNRAVVQLVQGNAAWSITMQSAQLGIPLLASTYQNAIEADIAKPGQPQFTMTATNPPIATNCNVASEFEVEAFSYDPSRNAIDALTATFHQWCTSDTTKQITGCVHYSP